MRADLLDAISRLDLAKATPSSELPADANDNPNPDQEGGDVEGRESGDQGGRESGDPGEGHDAGGDHGEGSDYNEDTVMALGVRVQLSDGTLTAPSVSSILQV
jgi:hypothetical protein